MVSELVKQTITSEFISDWVVPYFGLSKAKENWNRLFYGWCDLDFMTYQPTLVI